MAFASGGKNGSPMAPRPVVRVERPITVNSSIKPIQTSSTHSSVSPVRPKSASPSPSSAGRRASAAFKNNGNNSSGVPGRVRVALRMRPRNQEELTGDADFGDCIELQPELKRLKLRKNNWDCDTYQFDEVLTETASQKRVYEVVAKPVVESVLEGYNGTVMAYGQTGTGKTFTLGKLGEEDTADRGIMVRAMEDILANVSFEHDTVSVSYLQLYMESVQDLLSPEKDNITIVEDPKTGDVSLPGATLVELQDQTSFVKLLQAGENNRFAANTKLNTESSRSHAILLVNVKKVIKSKQDRELVGLHENGSPNAAANGNGTVTANGSATGNGTLTPKGSRIPNIRRSKLLIVDLAGSERVDKSGSEGHTLEEAKSINLSLTSLGKCINALAEGSPHVPIRDSKLTRLLRDSFGGTARTSLIVTIGPSPRHRGETSSTIMFGQRAMKVENMVKLKEEFDYKSLCRKLETDLDRLIADHERQTKAMQDGEEELERRLEEALALRAEYEGQMNAALDTMAAQKAKHEEELIEMSQKMDQERLQRERGQKELKEMAQDVHHQSEKKERQLIAEKMKLQKELSDLTQVHQKELAELKQQLDVEIAVRAKAEKELTEYKSRHSLQKDAADADRKQEEDEILHLKRLLEKETQQRQQYEQELATSKSQLRKPANGFKGSEEVEALRQQLEEQATIRQRIEEELRSMKEQLLQYSDESDELRRGIDRVGSGRSSFTGSESPINFKTNQTRDTINGQRATIAKLFEQVGLQKILSLLESEDVDVRVHAVKVVANLAAEEANQEKIVAAGGLGNLLSLLQSSEDETIRRVAAGAVANLAMNEKNQELIMAQGGIGLLARTADDAEDPQTLRMVAGAIANLCGNDKLQVKLREEGGIRSLLGMVRSRHPDVLAQVARGIANFAKCESRGAAQGIKTGRSLLIDDGALPWIVANANNDASPIRRHIELALCHLAQHEVNAKDLVAGGALWELVRISRECSREDIRNLAQRTLNASGTFQIELRRLHLVYS